VSISISEFEVRYTKSKQEKLIDLLTDNGSTLSTDSGRLTLSNLHQIRYPISKKTSLMSLLRKVFIVNYFSTAE
jgi:hypothetical protein